MCGGGRGVVGGEEGQTREINKACVLLTDCSSRSKEAVGTGRGGQEGLLELGSGSKVGDSRGKGG